MKTFMEKAEQQRAGKSRPSIGYALSKRKTGFFVGNGGFRGLEGLGFRALGV